MKKKNARYYQDNRERLLKKWSELPKEIKREYGARYRAKNADRNKAKQLKYRSTHRAECIARTKDWVRRNPERVRANGRASYHRKIARLAATGGLEAWREEQRTQHRAYYAANRDEIHKREKKLRALRKKNAVDPKIDLQWPYVTKRTSENEILLTINAIIPRNIQGDLRADVGSTITLAWVEDNAVIDALLKEPSKVNRFITEAKKQNYEKGGFGTESLDMPMRDGRNWHDILLG
jgi:hypothetical protein